MLTYLDAPRTGPAIAAMPQPTDRDAEQALVARALRGDVAAFETLYRTNARASTPWLHRLTGDARQARELTPDVFARGILTAFRGDAAAS
jgi:DNA-directed RNA polymerase specialized sigma24 family protein